MASPNYILTISFKVKLPWWWRLYVGAAKAFHDAGILVPDADVMTAFIIRRRRFYAKSGKGRWTRIKQ